GNNQGKGKSKLAYAPKPKIPPLPKKDNPVKDAICHQCSDIGHWKWNYPQSLAELLKNKKLCQGASTSGTQGKWEAKAKSFKFVRRRWSSCSR
ncbi:hypothetical protein Tco_0672717, partial [Tanacetum coccineum]